MARAPRTMFRCTECGTGAPRWNGKCTGCGSWNTLVEELEPVRSTPGAGRRATAPAATAKPIGDVDAGEFTARPTGVPELDRVLGGGLVPGSVTLVGGEPGIGKSTLLLQAAAAIAGDNGRVLVATAEESAQQVRLRAERLGALHEDLWLLAETTLPHIVNAVDEVKPELLVVDSIQTVFDPDLESAPGSVGQVRECAARLVRLAKDTGLTVVLVGHVTKEGALAGPRVLEHVVDTVLSFEGERHHALRLLRAVKHRFGSTSELGVFEMAEDGLWGVPDASAVFLADRRPGVAGSAVTATIEGSRPLLVEVQGLVAATRAPMPRRTAQGLDAARVAILLAVLEKRCGITFFDADVHASTTGGARVHEPGSDLAVALAVASAHTGVPLWPHVVACGEIGLGGELRQAGHLPRRLAEAARLGFRAAIVPASAPDGPSDLKVLRCETLADALGVSGLLVK